MAVDPARSATPTALDVLLHERPPGYFTDADLDALPETYQYEVVDGILLVNPPSATAHQRVAAHLFAQLRAACPDGVEVLYELGYRPTATRTLVPDLVVARSDVFDERGLTGRPLLVVEVRSPSTGLTDRTLKRAIYEEAGVPSYWMVDPDEPSLTVLELGDDGIYVEAARTAGDEVLTVDRPYPVSITLG